MLEQLSLYGLLAAKEGSLSPAFFYIAGILVFVVVMFATILLLLLKQYKRCPPNRLLVIWGRNSSRGNLKVIHGGAQFVMPLLEDYAYLSLEPIDVELSLSTRSETTSPGFALPQKFTVAISTAPELARTAAVRLLGLTIPRISTQAEEIIGRAIAQALDEVSGAERNVDQEAFYKKLESQIGSGLKELGMELVSMKRV